MQINTFLKTHWVRYFLFLVAIFASVEFGIRTHEDSVASLQDGALIKTQMFLLRAQTDLLVIGTSRTQDGINPTRMVEELGKTNVQWRNASAFNGAAAGGALKRLAYCADKAMEKPGLKLLGIEVSAAQIGDGAWSPAFYTVEKAKNVEDHLQQWLAEHVYTIRYRKTFRLENALKYPFLMFPNADDGTKFFGQVGKNLFANKVVISDEQRKSWSLSQLHPAPPPRITTPELIAGSERYLSAYHTIALKAKQKGIRLFLYVPPLSGGAAQRECDEKHLRTYQAIAQITQAPLLLHSCLDAPAQFFSDESHLNRIGKEIWSAQLAEDLLNTPIFKTVGGEHAF